MHVCVSVYGRPTSVLHEPGYPGGTKFSLRKMLQVLLAALIREIGSFFDILLLLFAPIRIFNHLFHGSGKSRLGNQREFAQELEVMPQHHEALT